jgi:hypothetical protein
MTQLIMVSIDLHDRTTSRTTASELALPKKPGTVTFAVAKNESWRGEGKV